MHGSTPSLESWRVRCAAARREALDTGAVTIRPGPSDTLAVQRQRRGHKSGLPQTASLLSFREPSATGDTRCLGPPGHLIRSSDEAAILSQTSQANTENSTNHHIFTELHTSESLGPLLSESRQGNCSSARSAADPSGYTEVSCHRVTQPAWRCPWLDSPVSLVCRGCHWPCYHWCFPR